LIAVELALRTGDDAERIAAKAHIMRLLEHDESARDPWVAAIARELETRCP
jgi:hypothetical protein